MTVTILICTRNRSARLAQMLESIRQLKLPPNMDCELVIVDNNSTDNTKIVVERFARTFDLSTRYVFEPRTGASHARNTGWRAAKGEIIACTDDDMILHRDWLAQAVEQCSEHPSVGLYFGQTTVARPGLARIALKEGNTPKLYQYPCRPDEPGSSNNMVLRRAVIDAVGGFDPALGPGSRVGGGEDTDFTYRALRSGALVRYCPEIVAFHDHDRLSASAIRSLLFVYGRSRGAVYCKHILRRDLWAAKMCYWEIRYFVASIVKKGKGIAALIHLSGMAIGAAMRLAMEIKGPRSEYTR